MIGFVEVRESSEAPIYGGKDSYEMWLWFDFF